MIVLIDNEHAWGYTQAWGEMLMAARVRIKYRLEDITGEPCLIVRFTHVSPEMLHALNVRAVFVSGSGTDADRYSPVEQEGLRRVFLAKAWPTFGFCGGFQVMAEAYGAPLERIGPLAPDDNDPNPQFAPGWQKEFGYQPVPITRSHPLLEGLGTAPIMRQAHSWEIKMAPPDFDVYASTTTSPIQLIIHRELPIVGAQFHPEYYTDDYPAGRVLIENFCRIAGLLEGDPTASR